MTAQIRRHLARWMTTVALFACLACSQTTEAKEWWGDYQRQGNALNNAGRYREAIPVLRRAIELGTGDPEVFNAYVSLSNSLNNTGEFDVSIANCNKAIELNPNCALAYNNRGGAWEGKKEYDKALADFNRAILLDPNYADAYASLAWFQATCFDARYRNGKKAFGNASTAYQLDGGKDPNYMDNLAAAYAECGDFDAAKEWENKAIARCADEKLKQVFQSHLESYKQKKPWRAKPDEVGKLF